jgi:hypothetical protein
MTEPKPVAALTDPDTFVDYLTDINPGRWEDAVWVDGMGAELVGCVLDTHTFDRVLWRAQLNDLNLDIDWLGKLENITTDEQWSRLTDRPRPLWVEVTTREQAEACGLLKPEDWATRAAKALCRIWSAEAIAEGMLSLDTPLGWCGECEAWVEFEERRIGERRIGEHMEWTADCDVCCGTTFESCEVPDHAVAHALRVLDVRRSNAAKETP